MFKDIQPGNFKPENFQGDDVIFFYMDGCSPCQNLFSIYSTIITDYPSVNFHRAVHNPSSQEFKDFFDYYDMVGYPTVVMKKSGIIKIFTQGGPTEEEKIRDLLDAVYKT